ncbi:MAG: ATP synthase subunit I [Pseudonocardiaceae bacterium]
MVPDLSPSATTAVNLKRLAVVASCVGVAGVAALAPFGHLGMALFGFLGLGLGLLNTALVQRSAARFAASGDPHRKRRSAGSVLGRLALITALAFVVALLVRPDGLGVFVGLAAFQLLMIFTMSAPLLRELRRSGAEGRSGAEA